MSEFDEIRDVIVPEKILRPGSSIPDYPCSTGRHLVNPEYPSWTQPCMAGVDEVVILRSDDDHRYAIFLCAAHFQQLQLMMAPGTLTASDDIV